MSDITTLMMAAAGQGGGGAETDPNFNQTVLLLHGDGTNGAQNNTFLDSSTNNFTITRNGNTTQGTFSPFSLPNRYWSVYFDGTDYLSKADLNLASALQFGTGDFTIETWVNFTKTDAEGGSSRRIFGFDTGTPFEIYIGATGTIVVWNRSTTYITSSALANTGQFVHIALTRSGTDLKLFINGTQSGSTATVSTNFAPTSLFIGANPGNVGTGRYEGYMSNFRILKGTALYTGTFTPSTTPLTAISNTSFLICQSNRFVDNSSNSFSFSVNGNPSVQPFSPFAPSAAYSASVNGGSGYFDGTGDYLSLASNADLTPASGDFCVECWIYPIAFGTYNGIFVGNAVGGFFFGKLTGGIGLRISATSDVISATAPSTNQWTHVAITRSGTDVRLFYNGVQQGSTVTNSTNFAQSATYIGTDGSGGSYWNGYISGLRFVKGSAVYTSNFTPSTTPLTAITNTELLTNFTNAGIFDNTGKNNLETVGNAQIDTTTKKYGTGSMEFDGTGDWLKVPNSVDIQLGTGDFTIEFWVYLATGDTGSNRGLVAKGGASTGWLVSLNTTEKVVFTYTTSTITSSGAITLDAWNHIAVVREGTGSNETKIYINGTNDGTGTVSTDFNQTEVMYIGANRAAGDPMKGFIDDLRITKGVARYTANFTPPTAAFPDL